MVNEGSAIEPEVSVIGMRVRAARQRARWSREALAFHSGLSWSAIAAVEAGRRKNTRPGTLSALAAALGVSADYLIGATPLPPAMLVHEAAFYDSDDALVTSALPFLTEGSERSEAVLMVAPEAKLQLLTEALGPVARQVEVVDSQEVYDDATRAVSIFRDFSSRSLEAGAPWVRILAEPPWTGRSESEIRILESVESVLNLSFAFLPLSILCPYDERVTNPSVLQGARATHARLVSGGESSDNPSYREPERYLLEREGRLR